MKILGVVGSPRKGGNTEILMKEVLEEAHRAGCVTEMFRMSEKQVAPCDACAACFQIGSCVLQDDMQELYSMFDAADGIIFGSPVYFGSVSAQLKAVMDRCFSLLRRRALKGKLAGQKDSLNKLITQQNALLAQLTPAQQVGTGPGAVTGATSTGRASFTGPTNTQAGKAVAFAYAQLGCPYVFGGTGPCQDGFDCSGLTMTAWASAGVSIPRTSTEQMSELPAVSTSELEPGDILGFAGNSHVGIYVGGGELIDAPQTGQDVQKVPLSGWFSENLDGAVRP